jgi:hypothetical protein
MLSNKPLTIRMFFDKGDFNNTILLCFMWPVSFAIVVFWTLKIDRVTVVQ